MELSFLFLYFYYSYARVTFYDETKKVITFGRTTMLPLYALLLFIMCSGLEISTVLNNHIDEDEKSDKNATNINYEAFTDLEDIREYNNSNVSLNTFFTYILNVSKLQLKNVHNKIKTDYSLNNTEISLIDNAFKNCDLEYGIILKRYFKKSFSNNTSTSNLSLSDLTDFSHFLLQKTIENNLELVEGELSLPTIWSKQSLKHKILRQQMKILMNVIDNQICWDLSLCIKRSVYTDYLVEWLRYLLNANTQNLNEFFVAIPPLVDKYMHLIRTNVKFRHKIKYVVQSDDTARRDLIDFIDEIFTNEDEIVNMIPGELKQSTILYLDLFELLDENYNLNAKNENNLDSISKMLYKWSNHNDIEITKILDTIVHNMELNIKIWPLAEQKRMDFIWLQILSL